MTQMWSIMQNQEHNNQPTNDLFYQCSILGNQSLQVSERLEKLLFTVLSAVSNLQGRGDSIETLESKVNDCIKDKD